MEAEGDQDHYYGVPWRARVGTIVCSKFSEGGAASAELFQKRTYSVRVESYEMAWSADSAALCLRLDV